MKFAPVEPAGEPTLTFASPSSRKRRVIAKRERPSERVRVRTSGETRDALVTDELRIKALEIERRPVERPVPAAPPPRQEGDATIISIVEERSVITKQLFVVEEVIVRRQTARQTFSVPVQLRRTRADVERATTEPAPSQQQDR